MTAARQAASGTSDTAQQHTLYSQWLVPVSTVPPQTPTTRRATRTRYLS